MRLLHIVFTSFAETRAQAIEDQVRATLGKGLDLAIQEEWKNDEWVITFTFLKPGDRPPPNCTLYELSKMPVGRP